jgi:hypothetical protein
MVVRSRLSCTIALDYENGSRGAEGWRAGLIYLLPTIGVETGTSLEKDCGGIAFHMALQR